MDSLTQFVLGAAVSTACIGRLTGPRKAAILGGVLATLPDLDVLQPYADPVDSFVFHRGWSHSLVVHALAAPVLGEALRWAFKSLQEHRWRVWATVFLCFSTHAALDALTIYGTRLFWPLYPDPVGLGSIFIIDPIYTLPLLIVTIWALFKGTWSQGFARGLGVALVVSSAYLVWGLAVQQHMIGKAERLFASSGIEPERILAEAGPFNTVLWKVIGLEEGRYHNLYLSLFDGAEEPPVYTHPRHPELTACLQGNAAFDKLSWFSRGYYRADKRDDRIVISDLRMGLTPNYTFSFAIADVSGGRAQAIMPERNARQARATSEGDLDWLQARISGRDSLRPAEEASLYEGATSKIVTADAGTC